MGGPDEFPGVPNELTIRFQPLTAAVGEMLCVNGYNPKLELVVEKNSLISDVAAYLNKKWCNVEGNDKVLAVYTKHGNG
jgi:hypothetical protein